MQLRRLGRSTLEIAVLCLGGNVFGGTIDEPTSFAVLDAYVEAGGNCIDTPTWQSLAPRMSRYPA